MKPFSYSGGAPDDYVCSKCGVGGVKLWRQYQVCADAVDLMCAACTLAYALKLGHKCGPVNDAGKTYDQDCRCWVDQVGFMVPAVPTEDGYTFWWYTSVPREGVAWWKELPTKPGVFVEYKPASEEPIAVGFYGHVHELTLEQAKQLSTQLIDAIRSTELRSIQSRLEQDGEVGM